MNLVQFSKPRIREIAPFHFRAEIKWTYHGKQYVSVGEEMTARRSLEMAFRPIVYEGWLAHMPLAWVMDRFKPEWHAIQAQWRRSL